MIRLFVVFCAFLPIAIIDSYAVRVANASPLDDPGQCTFVLPPPKVVRVSGANMVLATMELGPCTMEAFANFSVVCLSIERDDSAGQCASGGSTTRLYYAYRQGATYIVKGQGCASVLQPPYTICQDFAASRVAL